MSFVDDLVRGVGAAVKGMGSGTAKTIGKWWASRGAKTSAEAASKYVDDVIRGLSSSADDAAKIALRARNEIGGNLAKSVGHLDTVLTQLNKAKELAKKMPDVFNANELKTINRGIIALKQWKDLAKTEPQLVSGFMTKNSGLVSDIANLSYKMPATRKIRAAEEALTKTVKYADKILKSDASNLSNTAFIKKVMRLKQLGGAREKAFLANAKNAERLSELMGSPNVARLVASGIPMSMRESLRGLTLGEKATRIGLGYGTVLTAAGVGSMAVWDWMSDNDPTKINRAGRMLSTTFENFNSSGTGAQVLNKAIQSLRNITMASQRANKAMQADPRSAALNYVYGVGKEIITLNELLKNWGEVIKGADKPEEARKAGRYLATFVRNLSRSLSELKISLGHQPNAGIAGTPTAKINPNIIKIQRLLAQNYPEVKPTGALDRKTIRALRKVERKMNQRAQTYEFTGAFVVPEVGYVVKYNDLQEAYKRIGKY